MGRLVIPAVTAGGSYPAGKAAEMRELILGYLGEPVDVHPGFALLRQHLPRKDKPAVSPKPFRRTQVSP